jgi:predicted ArsR family transcriptional regulator
LRLDQTGLKEKGLSEPRYALSGVEGSILELLEQHGSLASEQVAALLQEPPDDVRNALNDLRERGLVDVVVIGRLDGADLSTPTYWRLTESGRSEIWRRRTH